MRADVYYNLHRGLWSVRDLSTGLVSAHVRAIMFPLGATMVVRKSGHRKALREGVKNVHAFVRGESPDMFERLGDWEEFGESLPDAVAITYNPKRADHFMVKKTGKRIDQAGFVLMVAPDGKPPKVWAVKENPLEA